MNKGTISAISAAICLFTAGRTAAYAMNKDADTYDVPITSIRCSDPYIFADSSDSTYYMYSTGGRGSVKARASKDLVNWSEAFEVMRFTDGHWAGADAASWASEVHFYKGRYYLFTTSHSREIIETIPGRCDIPHRATQIYVSESPRGPFRDFTGNKAHTPEDWASLDGTLWVEDGIPYMIFCHEWLQTVDGTMELVRLPDDLGVPEEEPVTLFRASDAKWSGEMLDLGEKTNGLDLGGNVTDGPWVFRTATGRLGMLWSTWGRKRYSIGAAYSVSGSIEGPWIQEDEPLFADNGGHGMLFRTFDGQLKLCMHVADDTDERPGRRPYIINADDSGDRLRIVPEKETVFTFDSRRTMAGKKIALGELNPDLPSDWSGYNYLVLEMCCSTAQRVYMGLNTEDGYNELRFIFYAPGGRIRTAIPLGYFRDLPEGAHDLAATYNHRRPLSYINIDHGTRSGLRGIDSIGFRMHKPVKDEEIRIFKAYLTVGDPGDKYLDTVPAMDEFGQWNLGEFEGKVHSGEELRACWAEEDAAIAGFRSSGRSAYGGDLSRKTASTGFFRVKKINGKWWFVDPDGYLFLSIGSNGMSPGRGGVRVLRFGDDEAVAKAKANGLVADRMDMWGMNTIGNWSGKDVIALGRKPFMVSIDGLGIRNGILGMPDVYAAEFAGIIEEGVRKSVAPYRDDRMLIGYFIGNEPAWSNRELRLCELISEAPEEMPLRQALVRYLEAHGDSPDSRKAFVYKTFEIFLSTVDSALRKYDPNHLNLGIRFGSGIPSVEVLKLSKKYFDVYSFNCYGIAPDMESMDMIYRRTGLPMIIGEYHFGTTDRGLGESLVRVTSQEERGLAYRSYTETAFSHKALIGASWFTWYDQPLFGRNDGENYNIGLIDVTDRPYGWMVKAIMEVSRNCYDIHDGRLSPFRHVFDRAGGEFPDIWEE